MPGKERYSLKEPTQIFNQLSATAEHTSDIPEALPDGLVLAAQAPLEALGAHLSNPWGVNFGTPLPRTSGSILSGSALSHDHCAFPVFPACQSFIAALIW